MRKVRITKCTSDSWWYSKLVGKIITIESNDLGGDYAATDKYKRNDKNELISTGFLLKTDCELISQ